MLEALKCTCATEHSIDLSKPVVTTPLASGETNPIRPFGQCGRSTTKTMIGSSSSPETIAMYRVDYGSSYSSEVSKFHGTKIGPTTCFAADKEAFITRYNIHFHSSGNFEYYNETDFYIFIRKFLIF